MYQFREEFPRVAIDLAFGRLVMQSKLLDDIFNASRAIAKAPDPGTRFVHRQSVAAVLRE